jgi:hypothetical protein
MSPTRTSKINKILLIHANGMGRCQMDKSHTNAPSNEEENIEEILLRQPSFSIDDDDKGISTCHIICQ